MSNTYAIDDGFSNQLSAGLSLEHAERLARRYANERGEIVHLYDAGAPEGSPDYLGRSVSPEETEEEST